MSDTTLSIMVVDDAKFSTAMISRSLKKQGFNDIRIAGSAKEALAALKLRPASLLLADWLMPEIDGLELTHKVRQLDADLHHYTYIILLTAREGDDALTRAFDQGVDDFINKSGLVSQLMPRVYAGERISRLQNNLLQKNKALEKDNENLQSNKGLQKLTGLGDAHYAEQRLSDTIRQVESRGGAACFILIGLPNIDDIENEYGEQCSQDILIEVGKRLRHLVRPLDAVAHLKDNLFAVVMYHPDVSTVRPGSFRRIYQGINLKVFKTTVGFINAKCGISICAADNSGPLPKPKQMIEVTQAQLNTAYDTGVITITYWRDKALSGPPPEHHKE